jgi:hypothetical protein
VTSLSRKVPAIKTGTFRTMGAYWESNPDCEFHKLEC